MGTSASDSVLVIGGGVIGLSIAWRAAQRGMRVTLADPAPGSGASHAAAGMITPISEAAYAEKELFRLGRESQRRYPAFAAELTGITGEPVRYRQAGTLQVAYDADDLAILGEYQALQESFGIPVRASPRANAATRSPCSTRLSAAACWPRATLRRSAAADQCPAGGRGDGRSGHHPAAGRGALSALAAGPPAPGWLTVPGSSRAGWSSPRAGTSASSRDCLPGRLRRCGRSRARSCGCGPHPAARRAASPGPCAASSGAPRSTWCPGRAASSSSAPPRRSSAPTRGLRPAESGELLRDARTIVPGITELELAEAAAGLRPGTPDNAPVLGPSALPGLVLATGPFPGRACCWHR